MDSRPPDDAEELETLLRSRGADPADESGRYALQVTRGPDSGLRFVLDVRQPVRVLVGTSPACELRLTDPEVSRRHAALDWTPRGLGLTDLGSTNGTFVNDVAISGAWLHGGELVRLG